MEKVLVTGANGFIGKNLCVALEKYDYEIIRLVRNKNSNEKNAAYWNPTVGELDEKVFEGVNHIIHLAGANIGEKRWTKKRKKELWDSRIETTNLLFKKAKNYPIKTFISASGSSYYGSIQRNTPCIENDNSGNDFLAQLTVAWEKVANQFEAIGTRVIKIRTGVVIDKEAEAFKKMIKPFQYNFGCVLGKGNQFLPWISLMDLISVYIESLTNIEFTGPINAVSPQQITNKEFTYLMAKVLNKKIWLPPVPSFILKIILGEMSTLVLTGVSIEPKKLKDLGFKFQDADLEILLKKIKKK